MKVAAIIIRYPGFILGLSSALWGLDPSLLPQRYLRRGWTTDQGLSSNVVSTIHQSRDGYLWIGTKEGVSRFGGVRFENFRPSETPGYGVRFVRQILDTRDGAIWVAGDQGLARLAGGIWTTWTAATGLPHSQANRILELADGTLLVGNRYGQVLAFLDGKFRELQKLPGSVQGMVEERPGRIWLAYNAGLFILHTESGSLEAVPSKWPAPGVVTLHRDRHGRIWAGRAGPGLTVYEDGVGRDIELGLPYKPVETARQIVVDRDDNVWFSHYPRGLARLRNGRLERLTVADGLPNSDVLGVYEDQEGSLWAGLAGGGLFQLRDTKFAGNGGISEGPDGSLWVCSIVGGVERFDRKSTPLGADLDHPVGILIGRDGAVWSTARPANLVRWKNGRKEVFPSPDQAASFVFSLVEDRTGRVWAGYNTGTLGVFDGTSMEPVPLPESTNGVRSLLAARDGSLWIGAVAGAILRLKDGAVTRAGRIANSTIAHMIEDRDGAIWAATVGAGLARVHAGRVQLWNRDHGIPSQALFGLMDTPEGELWAASSGGVLRMRKEHLLDAAAGRLSRVLVSVYDIADGLPSTEIFDGTWPPVHRDRKGLLWFATTKGLAAIDPARLRLNPATPRVAIESVTFDGVPQRSAGRMRLGPGRGDLSINFTALAFAPPEKSRFRYRLEGREWVEAGGRREAFFTFLPPGTYRFAVQSTNGDGVWNAEGASVDLEIAPHFYQAVWFYLLCILAAGTLGWRVYRYRVRRLVNLNAELEGRVRSRTQELLVAKETAEMGARAKSQFLANMSHELRTPMNAVVGMSTLMMDMDMTPDARECLALIRTSADAQITLINDILDLSKIEAGKLEIERLPFNLVRCVRDSTAMLAVTAREKGVPLVTQVDPSAPEWVLGDVTRVRQVLINLLTNAVKFTTSGEVNISVASRDGELWFSVKDTGIGIPPDRLDRLFQPFSQVDSSTTRRYGGTGLGLAICRKLVDLMGGRIWVDSEPGTGSNFQFVIPAIVAREPGAEDRDMTGPLLELDRQLAQRHPLRILLAEDNAVNQRVCVRMLERMGYRVDIAWNGAEALDALSKQTYDVVLMDVQMPEMDGLEAARRIRQMWPGAGPRLVAITANALESDRKACFDAGMDDYLTKPINVHQLRDALVRYGGQAPAVQ
ncbi:MAG: response regulator [Acidobacteria bacterium]|nr:response regulator [Acidobacteriota bacterium]